MVPAMKVIMRHEWEMQVLLSVPSIGFFSLYGLSATAVSL